MPKTKLFISSVQAEFAEERQALYEYILADPLLGRFFEPFLFECLPASDQLADSMHIKVYNESIGTVIADMLSIAAENNLQDSVFEQNKDFKTIIFRPCLDQVQSNHPLSTPQVPLKYPTSSIEIMSLIAFIEGEMSRLEIQNSIGLKDAKHLRENYLDPALTSGLIQMNYPNSPNHPKQKYLLTELGENIKYENK